MAELSKAYVWVQTPERVDVERTVDSNIQAIFLRRVFLCGGRDNLQNTKRADSFESARTYNLYVSSGACPSCASHIHSVIFISEKIALKEEFSGLQA